MNDNEGKGLVCRLAEGARNSGPGWLLSAYTLGAGTAASSALAGATFGYALLWVNPMAMLIGVLVLACAGYSALSSEKSPFHRFRTELSPVLAYAWGGASLLASVIWHFPQYSMAHASICGLGGIEPSGTSQFVIGAAVLAVAILVTWQYRAGVGLLVYESIMKLLVWVTVLCLVVLMFRLPIDWLSVLRGTFIPRIPQDSSIFVFGLLGAAVGINMTFLYPYSVRCKGWGPEGPSIARRDLLLGMFLPFALATGMLMVACAATPGLRDTPPDQIRSNLTAIAGVFEPAFGKVLGPKLFLLGLLAMPLSTITLHMLTCGFILSEMTGAEQGSRLYKLGTLIPAIGVLGVAYPMPVWLPVPTSALCLVLLPIAYIGFAVLFARDLRKKDALPLKGARVQLVLAVAAIALVTVAAAVKLHSMF